MWSVLVSTFSLSEPVEERFDTPSFPADAIKLLTAACAIFVNSSSGSSSSEAKSLLSGDTGKNGIAKRGTGALVWIWTVTFGVTFGVA
jgi:hypothetical protein